MNPFRKPQKTVVGTHIAGQGAKAETLEIEFSDGKHWVPDWIVVHYGGKEKFDLTASTLLGVTYQEFSQALFKAIERDGLNKIQQNIMRNFRFGK